MTTPILTVSAKAIIATNLFRNPDGGVGPTHGIHVKPDGQGGAIIIASNGHALAMIHEPGGDCFEAVTILPSKSFVSALRAYAKKPWTLVRFDGERLSLALGENIILDQHDGCKMLSSEPYPDFSKAILTADKAVLDGHRAPSLSVPFDGLKLFQAVAKLYDGNVQRTLSLYPSGPSSPCIVRLDCNPDFVGVVMPMHESETGEHEEPESATYRDEPLKGFDSAVLL